MVHGYHVILSMYGFRLPNDPCGSWSEVVGKWELLRYGSSTIALSKDENQRKLADLSPAELALREQARESLKYPPVELTGVQAKQIASGFAKQIQKSGYTMWACSILPTHTHLVLARYKYKVEQMVNLFKGRCQQSLGG